MLRKLLLVLPAVAVLTLVGCGGGGSTVTGTVTFGNTKPAAEDKYTLTLNDGKNGFSSEVDAAGNFKFENVPDGAYTVTIMHYKTTPAGAEPKPGKPPSGPGAPVAKTYPDTFKVPGGPYTVDMSKLAPPPPKK